MIVKSFIKVQIFQHHFQTFISLDSTVQKSDAAKSHDVNLILNAAIGNHNFLVFPCIAALLRYIILVETNPIYVVLH